MRCSEQHSCYWFVPATLSGVSLCMLLWSHSLLGIAQGLRVQEGCDGYRAEGEKWFDGCQWCVCTSSGVRCSRSDCSGLVKKVPPCAAIDDRWTDGCYHCRCRRIGIRCRLNPACSLLRHQPVACLTDDRCICGLDGVPSCTAEVIDRDAFPATRVSLGSSTNHLPEVIDDLLSTRRSNRDKLSAGKISRLSEVFALPMDGFHKRRTLGVDDYDVDDTSNELLIMSDNLCVFGSRWYGGSLRCFCDIDGAITCGNPTYVTAFIDHFTVERKECEEGHVWEEDCSVCSCRINGVIFCRRPRADCKHKSTTEDADDDEFSHYLPIATHPPEITSHTVLPKLASTLTSKIAETTTPKPLSSPCKPGSRWNVGCIRCYCNPIGRVICNKLHCDDGNKTSATQMPKEDERKTDKEADTLTTKEQTVVKSTTTRKVAEPEVTANPSTRGPRGPIMPPPNLPTRLTTPAYISPQANSLAELCSGKGINEMFWMDCNLCICTIAGPKCQFKSCS